MRRIIISREELKKDRKEYLIELDKYLSNFSKRDLFNFLEELVNLSYEKDRKEFLYLIMSFKVKELKKRLEYIREYNKV